MNFLAYIDYFGARPTWMIGGRTKSPSKMSLILTTLLVTFVIWATIYLSSDLIHRENPKVTMSSYKGDAIDDQFPVNDQHFSYVFGVIGADGVFFVDNSIYTFTATVINNDDLSSYQVSMVPCAPADINISVPYVGTLWCFDSSESKIFVKGVNGAIDLNLSMCVNSTLNNNSCAPQTVINNNFMINNQFYVFFPIHSVVPTNYTDPIQKSYNYQNFKIVPDFLRRISLVIKRISIDTDVGWLLNDITTLNQTAHDTYQTDADARAPGLV